MDSKIFKFVLLGVIVGAIKDIILPKLGLYNV